MSTDLGLPPDERLRLLDLPVADAVTALEQILVELDERPFRAKQVLAQVYRRRVRSFEGMTDLPAALRSRLSERARLVICRLHGTGRHTHGIATRLRYGRV